MDSSSKSKNIQLSITGENMLKWKRSMEHDLESKHGVHGKVFKTETALTRAEMTIDDIYTKYGLRNSVAEDRSTAANLMARRDTELAKLIEADKTIYAKICAELRSSLSTEGLRKVESEAEFAQAYTDNDIVKLKNLIIKSHNLNALGLPEAEAADQAYNAWYASKQGNKDLDSFADDEELLYQNLKALKYHTIPDDKQRAHRFLRALNANKLRDFMIHTTNESRAGTKPLPDTIAKVIKSAKLYLPSQTKNNDPGSQLTYSSLVDTKPEKPKGNKAVIKCGWCDKGYHEESECICKLAGMSKETAKAGTKNNTPLKKLLVDHAKSAEREKSKTTADNKTSDNKAKRSAKMEKTKADQREKLKVFAAQVADAVGKHASVASSASASANNSSEDDNASFLDSLFYMLRVLANSPTY